VSEHEITGCVAQLQFKLERGVVIGSVDLLVEAVDGARACGRASGGQARREVEADRLGGLGDEVAQVVDQQRRRAGLGCGGEEVLVLALRLAYECVG